MSNFLWEFFKKPLETGAIAPSSITLSRHITDSAHLPDKRCVVELGSGTGVFTKQLLREISPKCVFFCLEINPQFASDTRKNCPAATVYQASGKEIKRYLSKHQKDSCDCIISGLPWAAFPKRKQRELLEAVYGSLGKGGVFLTFAYIHGLLLPAGLKFRKMLKERFKNVQMTSIVWKNLPPAFVYCCKK